MNRVVMACFGDPQSAARIQQTAEAAEVVAVAMDFGGAVSLAAMRELALASGAVRCHALDVRETFARDVMLPAVQMRAYADPAVAFAALVPEFAWRQLQQIAELEHAVAIPPEHVIIAARRLARAIDPLHVDLTFEDGVPTAINGVPMTLTELMESLETITGEPALCVIERAMARAGEPQLR